MLSIKNLTLVAGQTIILQEFTAIQANGQEIGDTKSAVALLRILISYTILAKTVITLMDLETK